MTASWTVKGETSNGQTVEMSFFTRGLMRRTDRYFVTLATESGQTRRRFSTQRAAELWALECGVSHWALKEQSRALPYAELIPINFSDAPTPETLADLIAQLDDGVPLNELVENINAAADANSRKVTAAQLRLWLFGFAPLNPAIEYLRTCRKR